MVECHPNDDIGDDEAAQFMGQQAINAYDDQTEAYEVHREQ